MKPRKSARFDQQRDVFALDFPVLVVRNLPVWQSCLAQSAIEEPDAAIRITHVSGGSFND